ncbi:10631_t:CDS:2 [Entrophospora sp. SA101]|nr:5775_t:CDS:2 [Entrophospora sp. SA101]CAJ0885004.1 5779_t:CDS:2 [Entrophospora sp. SA101]CAJ0912677.1 10631_t:CDS:2 [Entrophospora sp. SA101]
MDAVAEEGDTVSIADLTIGLLIDLLKDSNDNYEKILSELDDNIRKAEICLGEIKIRERNALIIWIVYSLLAYIAYVVGYWYFIYMSNEGENWDFMKVAPVLTGPFFIVIGYRFIALWYKREETNEISQLEQLRAKQSLKVEELKKKTGYYTTKTLLERYDSTTKLPANLPGQKNLPLTTAPGNLKLGPNSLRQRLPPPNNNNNSGVNNNNGNIDQQLSRSLSSSSINQINNIQNQQRHWYDKLVDVVVGRSTTPKPTSRDSSSGPEKSKEKHDNHDDDGDVAVNKRLTSRSRSKGSHHGDGTEGDDNNEDNVKDEV